MLPGEEDRSGGQAWTDESLHHQNSDWIATTSGPSFDLGYATPSHGAQHLFPAPNASADPELDPLRAGATGAFSSFHQSQNWNLDDENHAGSYGWPSVLSASPSNVRSIQPLTNPTATRDVHNSAARPPIGPLNVVSGPLGQDPGSQIAQRDFANYRSFLSPPVPREPSRTSPVFSPPLTRIHTVAQETTSTSQAQQAGPQSASSGKTLSPSSAQVSPTRKRKGGQRSPSSRQAFPRTPFQPNEEEEARRIHMASLSRGGSLVSSVSSHSRGLNEHETLGVEGNLRAAESTMLETIGAPGVLRALQPENGPSEQYPLPPGKGFPIQIGSELFRLSGASIMSDSPSYFSRFFEDQVRQNEDGTGGVRTLYIDRDPATFRDICRHLQGYMIQPTDGANYVRLFADAQFYSLPRLISQLFDSETVIQIGGENFQIPRDIFSGVGDTPNYFSLGFAAFFNTPADVFPGLHPFGLLRPPPIRPPTVPNRCARVFAELLHLLRGYPLTIRDDNHRAELLRDCRYFNLKGLEQKLIAHDISHNAERDTSEIVIRLDDIRQSGISFVEDPSSPAGWVHYARPFVDEESHELILEIAYEATKVDLRSMRAEFYRLTKARISKLFQVVANKMNLPVQAPLGLMMSAGGAGAQDASPGNTPLSEDQVKVRIGDDAFVILDGEEYVSDSQVFEAAGSDDEPAARAATSQRRGQPPRKRRRRGSLDDLGEWNIRRGQWRLRVQPRVEARTRGGASGGPSGATGGYTSPEGTPLEIVLHAVKLDAVSGQRGRNMMRGFLTAGSA